jgi:hypothetical protein
MATTASRQKPATKPRRASASRVRRTTNTISPLLGSYWSASQSPLLSLLFILPLLALHEIGVQWYGGVPGRVVEYRIAAFTLLNRFFHTFGASGRYLPALAVVAVLLSWHIARRDEWNFRISLLPLMLLESVAWAVPLLGVYFLFSPRAPIYLPVGEWKLMASLYLGAGVYEELIFRLAAFSLLSFFLIDLARWPTKLATPLIVLASAATFSAYHMLGISHAPWQAFVFIALRGVFYGIIFLERGFGLSVGVHTAYDLIFLSLRQANVH